MKHKLSEQGTTLAGAEFEADVEELQEWELPLVRDGVVVASALPTLRR